MKPVFIVTENVKNFISTMENVKKRMGHDSLAMIWGRAGRGKTRTSRWYATQNNCVYLTSLRDWSVLWMYQDILKGMGISNAAMPKRKKQAFEKIMEESEANPRPIILDEADLLGPRLLESIRDLCKMMWVPWVLVGEDSLPGLMNKDRRVWSRRCASMHFEPMETPDIISFCEQATGLSLPVNIAEIIQRQSGGDIRLIELTLSTCETIAKANKTKEITTEMAKNALKKVIPER